jgi:hypothetical protein
MRGAVQAAAPETESRMVTKEDIDSYLLRMESNADEVEPGMWVIESEHGKLVLHHSPPLLLLRMKVLAVPAEESKCTGLFRRLLELNATDLVHGAYGIEEGDVILSDALELENLDFNEFQSSVDSMQLALASHLEQLSEFRDC